MEYRIEEIRIRDLIDLIDKNGINLKPSYQRNFIWSPNDQRFLIDSILSGFPLPNFFVYEASDGSLEMVDGQQRARTIYRFWKGIIYSSKKLSINEIDEKSFLNYRLNWVIINNLVQKDSLENFYVLVNKRGKHLNTPELFKADYHHTKFLTLVEDLLDVQDMINLDLFSDVAAKRMNDRGFVEELVAYLKVGITDKKEVIERIYKTDIDDKEYHSLKNNFTRVISKINILNNFSPINKTRFKQKNDFYTLFNFINESIEEHDDLQLFRYKILLLLAPDIKPSNDDCLPLKEYADKCVSQSNSKNARVGRLNLFNKVLKNKDVDKNDELKEILDFLEAKYMINNLDLVRKGEYELLNVEQCKNSSNV